MTPQTDRQAMPCLQGMTSFGGVGRSQTREEEDVTMVGKDVPGADTKSGDHVGVDENMNGVESPCGLVEGEGDDSVMPKENTAEKQTFDQHHSGQIKGITFSATKRPTGDQIVEEEEEEEPRDKQGIRAEAGDGDSNSCRRRRRRRRGRSDPVATVRAIHQPNHGLRESSSVVEKCTASDDKKTTEVGERRGRRRGRSKRRKSKATDERA
ncbi:uncharacterized protein LOC135215289 [Macrobrachium nipponense]|uniref:uncharacterized protein LOC135215289 n=1 Tax=Macrobrachium nipponense TaxID=159736 RepID=UPI0030C8A7EC